MRAEPQVLFGGRAVPADKKVVERRLGEVYGGLGNMVKHWMEKKDKEGTREGYRALGDLGEAERVQGGVVVCYDKPHGWCLRGNNGAVAAPRGRGSG